MAIGCWLNLLPKYTLLKSVEDKPTTARQRKTKTEKISKREKKRATSTTSTTIMATPATTTIIATTTTTTTTPQHRH